LFDVLFQMDGGQLLHLGRPWLHRGSEAETLQQVHLKIG
jgi:hypothetical protein